MSEVIAILASDIHLSHSPPIARSAEPDWYKAMKRPWEEVIDVANRAGVAPIIVAGDLFDKHNSPPSLINWAIRTLPPLVVLPGQHDLPLHRMDLLQNSAYWTLVESETITHVYRIWKDDAISIHAFHWGEDIKRLDDRDNCRVNLAVAHAYIWMNKSTSYPGAPEEKKIGAYREQLKGYDAAVFGDNHISFLAKAGDCNVINPGSFYRRRIDEIDHKPMIGLLHEDGTIEPHYLDCSQDKFIDEAYQAKEVKKSESFTVFMDELRKASPESLDYRQAVRAYVNAKPVPLKVKSLLLESIGAGV